MKNAYGTLSLNKINKFKLFVSEAVKSSNLKQNKPLEITFSNIK